MNDGQCYIFLSKKSCLLYDLKITDCTFGKTWRSVKTLKASGGLYIIIIIIRCDLYLFTKLKFIPNKFSLCHRLEGRESARNVTKNPFGVLGWPLGFSLRLFYFYSFFES